MLQKRLYPRYEKLHFCIDYFSFRLPRKECCALIWLVVQVRRKYQNFIRGDPYESGQAPL